jgi:hypothetical protein
MKEQKAGIGIDSENNKKRNHFNTFKKTVMVERKFELK